MAQPLQGFKYWLKVGQGDLRIELLGEALQVNVGGIDVLVDIEEGLAGDVAVGDHHIVESGGMRFARDVDDVLAPDRRLVIGEREVRDAALEGEFNDIAGR